MNENNRPWSNGRNDRPGYSVNRRNGNDSSFARKFSKEDEWNRIDNEYRSFVNGAYRSCWIKEKADPELVEFAREVGEKLCKGGLTTSKIRSIFGELKRIQTGDFGKLQSSFYLLKPKVAYAVGRDKGNDGLRLFRIVFDKGYDDVCDEKSFQNFCNLMEAVLAYHKYYKGDKD